MQVNIKKIFYFVILSIYFAGAIFVLQRQNLIDWKTRAIESSESSEEILDCYCELQCDSEQLSKNDCEAFAKVLDQKGIALVELEKNSSVIYLDFSSPRLRVLLDREVNSRLLDKLILVLEHVDELPDDVVEVDLRYRLPVLRTSQTPL